MDELTSCCNKQYTVLMRVDAASASLRIKSGCTSDFRVTQQQLQLIDARSLKSYLGFIHGTTTDRCVHAILTRTTPR